MLETLLEGFASIALPCTLALLLPGLGIVAAARRNAIIAVAALIGGATLVIWLKVIDNWIADPADLGLGFGGPLLVGAIYLAASGATWRWPDDRRLVAGAAAVVGAVAGWLWRPCVGSKLADILNTGESDPIGNILPLLAYVLGVLTPLIAIALLPVALPKLQAVRDHQATAIVGLGISAVIGLTIATGSYGNVVAELVRASSL